ncbi:DUF4232 domain-containing protein [Nocardia stercoris]|nr:DUF4232 domain-containing protein [Nocardia stercoris]
MLNRRFVPAVLVAVAALAGAAACTPDDSATPGTPVTVVTPSGGLPAPSSVPGSAAPHPATGTSVPAGNPVSPCGSGKVGVFVQSAGSGAGHTGAEIIFSLPAPDNIACTLTGYPGVDIVDTTGTVHHAERTLRGYLGGLPQGDDTLPTVVVRPGHPAHALFEGTAARNGSGESCGTAKSTQVTPPDSTATESFSTGVYLCNLQIHPVTADE